MRIAKKYSQLRLHTTLIHLDVNITGCKEKIISQMFRQSVKCLDSVLAFIFKINWSSSKIWKFNI